MKRKVSNVVIVGGGAAGWWTAGYLAVKNPHLHITLIESDRIPAIGVGESMLPQISEFFLEMGIDEKVWMQDCDAIYKLGNKFENWYEIGDSSLMTFWWNFDERLIKGSLYNRPGNEVFFGQKKHARLGDYWLHLYSQGEKNEEDFYYDFSDAAGLAEGLCSPRDHEGHSYLSSWAGYAYHIDANKASTIVRDHAALPNGVEHRIGTVADVKLNADGIEQLHLESGEVIKADLYIDCTGFAQVLIGQLDTTRIHYENIFCNSVFVSPFRYNDYRTEMVPYTTSTARKFGWQFTIPLTSRIGSGYVYSDRFTTDAEAVAAFKQSWCHHQGLLEEPRLLKWQPSRLRDSWQQNVCAIGLASGFIEPLEANVLFNAQHAIQTLTRLLERGNNEVTPKTAKIFSRATAQTMDHTADYLFHRYAATAREDTEFWRTYKQLGEAHHVRDTLMENYMKHSDPLSSLYPDAIWLSTAVYMKALRRDLPVRINPDLVDNARAIFDYTARTSRNNGRMLPKIWDVCPPRLETV
ncbi:MAG: tryptophan 7-halogenase [Cyanobacteria bacterium P01_F01_bin.56]